MTDQEDTLKNIYWFDEINLIDCEENPWYFSDSEDENKMDQNDVLSTQANTNSGFEYDAHTTNINPSTANFSYAGEIISNYASSESTISTPMSTNCNEMTDSYKNIPNFVGSTNYYDCNSISPQHYQKLDPDKVHYDQTTAYENFSTSEKSPSEPMDTYMHVSEPQISTNNPVQFDSVVKEHDDFLKDHKNVILENEFNHLQSSSTGELTEIKNDIPNDLCEDVSHQNVSNYTQSEVSHAPNNYSESSNNDACYTEASQEIKMETNSQAVGDIYASDSTPNQNNSLITEERVAVYITSDSTTEEIKKEEIKEEEEAEIIDIRNEKNTESQNETHVQNTSLENETKNLANGNKFVIQTQNVQMCIRNGCVNRAINNPEWEQEFCSNDCVIIHCSNVFTEWVKANETVSQ